MMKRMLLIGSLAIAYALSIGTGQFRAQSFDVIEAAVPGYPRLAWGGYEAGEVQVDVDINPEGLVVSAKACSGPDRLRRAAEAAARKWKFVKQDRMRSQSLVFAFIPTPGVEDPPLVHGIFRSPNRIEVFAEERKSVVNAEPQMVDVEKERKKKKKEQKPE